MPIVCNSTYCYPDENVGASGPVPVPVLVSDAGSDAKEKDREAVVFTEFYTRGVGTEEVVVRAKVWCVFPNYESLPWRTRIAY